MGGFIEKLTGQRQFQTADSRMAGLLNDFNQPRLRVGLWPIISDSAPETAMGLGAVLAFLLERYSAIRVYRLFARLTGDPAHYEWKIGESQFEVDDWSLDHLGENAAIWGRLEKSEEGYKLTVEVEDDLSEDDPKSVTVNSDDLGGIIVKLIACSEKIADYLDAGIVNPISPAYEVEPTDEEIWVDLLARVFSWELHLFLSLWGKSWPETEISEALEGLVTIGKQVKGDFGAWIASMATTQALLENYSPLDTVIAKQVSNLATELREWPVAQVILGKGIFVSGDTLLAYNVLESAVEAHPDDAVTWFTLAELYRQGNDWFATIDTLQRAIEAEVDATGIYLRYGEMMLMASRSNFSITAGKERLSPTGRAYNERYIFVERNSLNILVHEAAGAYQAALEIEPKNLEALYQFNVYLIDQQDETKLWPEFSKLVNADEGGEYIRKVIDLFYNLEDISSGIKILETAVETHSKHLDLYICLAAAYLADEDYEAAQEALKSVNVMIGDDAQSRSEVEYLRLVAEDPDFEADLGEIVDLVNSEQELSPEDVEFLEDILDKAPRFAMGYTLLGSAYLQWGENDDALDVLLDAQKQVPGDGEIALLLARVLWDSGEQGLAFDCLNKGLGKNPTHVGLLALAGQYLFEDHQDDASKEFLARAEALNPNDVTLRQVRNTIARQLAD